MWISILFHLCDGIERWVRVGGRGRKNARQQSFLCLDKEWIRAEKSGAKRRIRTRKFHFSVEDSTHFLSKKGWREPSYSCCLLFIFCDDFSLGFFSHSLSGFGRYLTFFFCSLAPPSAHTFINHSADWTLSSRSTSTQTAFIHSLTPLVMMSMWDFWSSNCIKKLIFSG